MGGLLRHTNPGYILDVICVSQGRVFLPRLKCYFLHFINWISLYLHQEDVLQQPVILTSANPSTSTLTLKSDPRSSAKKLNCINKYCLLCYVYVLTLSSLSLPLSSSSTTSCELLSQLPTCSGWRWLEMGEKLKKIAMYWWTSFMKIFGLKPSVVGKWSLFSGM